jgi:hypothetical protein
VTFYTFFYFQHNIYADITKKIFAFIFGEAALFQLTTVIRSPFRLADGVLVLTPPGKIDTFATTGTSESCGGDRCVQRWNQALHLSNGTCTLDGQYRMNFTKTCSDASNCPLSDTEKTAAVDFNLVSENFCAEISVEIGLYGSIKIYDDSNFQNARSSFIVGTRAYFLITINSDANANPYDDNTASIKFSDTILITVTIRVEGYNDIVRIFESGHVSSDDYGSGIQSIDRSEVNMVGFSFMFTLRLIEALNCTGKVKVTIGAEVQVNYLSGNSTKRAILVNENGSEKTSVSTTNELDTTESHGNNAVVIIGSLFFVLFALLL